MSIFLVGQQLPFVQLLDTWGPRHFKRFPSLKKCDGSLRYPHTCRLATTVHNLQKKPQALFGAALLLHLSEDCMSGTHVTFAVLQACLSTIRSELCLRASSRVVVSLVQQRPMYMCTQNMEVVHVC